MLLATLSGAFVAPYSLTATEVDELRNELRSLKRLVQQIQVERDGTDEEDERKVKRDDLQGIQSDLENFKFQVQREREKTALPTRPLSISGIVQTRASFSEIETTTASVDRRKSTFDIGSAILGFRGNLYRDYEEGRNLSYTLTTLASNGSSGVFSVLDANINYAILPTLSPETARLGITLGQQQIPFGLEVQATEDLKPVINNAQFSSRLDLATRQNGLILRGDLAPEIDFGYNYRVPLLEYALGVVNGNGANAPDNNNAKDLVGRLALAVPSDYNSLLRQIILGVSYYEGQQNQVVGTSIVGQGLKQRQGLDLSYNHHPIGITYELIQGVDELALGTVPDAVTFIKRKSRSHTGTLFYNFGEQFVKGYRAQARFDDWWPKSYQPFLRFDSFDPDTGATGDDIEIQTLGLNIFFAETTKIQINVNRRDDSVTAPYRELLAQAQFGF
jgi:hypothetical protein